LLVEPDPEPEVEEEEEDREMSPDTEEIAVSQYASHFTGMYIVLSQTRVV
jgi:hypothetical protein